MASQLADCWGILGGIEWRWALDPASDAEQRHKHLGRSSEAYEKGYEYELESLSSGTSTYNRLNRLLVRVLDDPTLLTTDAEAAPCAINVRAEIKKIHEELSEELRKHPPDSVWTAADMALLNVLLGHQDAASAYAVFEGMNPPDYARQSALDMLNGLSKLDLPTAKALQDAVSRLGSRRG
jgi:hypothetical protein